MLKIRTHVWNLDCMLNPKEIQHSMWTLNMRLNWLTFNWVRKKLHVNCFPVDQTIINISEGILLSNSTYFFINVLCMLCFQFISCIFGQKCKILDVQFWKNPVQTSYSMKLWVSPSFPSDLDKWTPWHEDNGLGWGAHLPQPCWDFCMKGRPTLESPSMRYTKS